jgi:hypothetical protein
VAPGRSSSEHAFLAFFAGKRANLSGDGDTCRRIDATSSLEGGIIRALGWTITVASRMLVLAGPCGARIAQGDQRLRIVGAAFKACLGIVALSLATTGLASPAGTESAVVSEHATVATKTPSIKFLNQQTGLAGTCGGSAFDVNTFIDVDAFASADVKVDAPGVGLIEEFTDETGTNLGPYDAAYPTFHIRAFGGGLPPNTPITITITTYSGATLTGSVSSRSSLVFDCTTGVVLAPARAGGQAIPSLSGWVLAATAALLGLIGAAALRRPTRRRFARR